jgi:arginine decarboxylase
MNKSFLIGNRIPRDFFITKGSGESDITVHAGSYHLALKEANIEKFNIMTYSSILPKEATLILQPENIIFGSVLESIMAVSTGNVGNRISAGIIYGWLYDKTNQKYGGLVCEHNGNYEIDEINFLLRSSLNELYINGFQDYEMKDINVITNSFIPEKKYGTTLVSLCFVNYIVPYL